MKRGHYVLISGAALFVIGIVIAASIVLQITDWFLQDNVFVEDWPLEVGEPKTLSLQVTDAAKPLNILLITHPDTALNVVLVDPNDNKIVSSTYSRTSKDVQATVPGTYTLMITNIGSSLTQVDAALRQPEITTAGEVESMIDSVSGILGVGILLVITGIIVIILGVVLIIKGKRQKAGVSASSRQN